ncbi:protein phosphatase 2C 27 [Pyrus ussuriensis x Pyrus communis]|uniref:Protein phosphatase 2C 27 n=1 Tax=Pyrus ussuriensis x Pyrus communis TaxID=2448454 RepID=A0A5N5GX48_9ROSA|nr:protein phosphatase 2C 27 [Pyrus ussuriensis x Pyrus communis]
MTPPRFSILSLSYLQFGLWSLDISAALPITKHSSTIPSISNYQGPAKITKYILFTLQQSLLSQLVDNSNSQPIISKPDSGPFIQRFEDVTISKPPQHRAGNLSSINDS